MKRKQPICEVIYTNMKNMDGYAIMSPEGELDVFYPTLIRPPEQLGYTETVEISMEFFRYISLLQARGMQVVFKR